MLFKTVLMCLTFFELSCSGARTYDLNDSNFEYSWLDELNEDEFQNCIKIVNLRVMETKFNNHGDKVCFSYPKSGYTECQENHFTKFRNYFCSYIQTMHKCLLKMNTKDPAGINYTNLFKYFYGSFLDLCNRTPERTSEVQTEMLFPFSQPASYFYQHALDGLQNCSQIQRDQIMERPILITKLEESCYIYTNSKFYQCVRDLGTKLNPYLGPEEKYLPGLLLNGIKNSASKICNIEKEKQITTVNNLYSTNPEIILEGLGNCVLNKKLLLSQLGTKNFIYKQAYICTDIHTVHDCLLEAIAQDLDRDYSDFLDEFFRSYFDWCNNLQNRSAVSKLQIEIILIVFASILYQALTSIERLKTN